MIPQRPRPFVMGVVFCALVCLATPLTAGAAPVGQDNATRNETTAPPPTWNTTVGTDGGDSARDVIRTADGGYLVAGYLDLVSPKSDAFLAKLGPHGTVVWNRTYGGPTRDKALSVVRAADGGYVFAGTTTTPDDPGNAWLVKVGPNGQERWTVTVGGTGRERVTDLTRTGNGRYVLTGMTRSFGVGPNTRRDVLVVGVDGSGSVVLNETFGDEYGDTAWGIAPGPNGGVVVGGTTAQPDSGKTDGLLLAVGPDGTRRWQRVVGGSETDQRLNGIARTDGGRYVATGYTTASGNAASRPWLVGATGDGTVRWTRATGESGVGMDVGSAADGGFLLTGFTGSDGPTSRELVLGRFAANGTQRWYTTAPSAEGIDAGYAVVSGHHGGIVTTGNSQELGSSQGNSAWLARFGYGPVPDSATTPEGGDTGSGGGASGGGDDGATGGSGSDGGDDSDSGTAAKNGGSGPLAALPFSPLVLVGGLVVVVLVPLLFVYLRRRRDDED